jgi:hypothetical protein
MHVKYMLESSFAHMMAHGTEINVQKSMLHPYYII